MAHIMTPEKLAPWWAFGSMLSVSNFEICGVISLVIIIGVSVVYICQTSQPCTISLLTLQCASVVTYRITMHPLARYPGPFFAKVTDIYAAYHGFRGDIHIDILKCHAEYGTSRVLSQYLHLADS